MKKFIIYAVCFSPITAIFGILGYYIFFTSLPYDVYLNSARNLYFNCLELKNEDFIYEATNAECTLDNLEYSTSLRHLNGRRNPRELKDSKVALLGDSHTHGLGVNDNETFSAILRNTYQIENINLGIGSYATQRELESYLSKSPYSKVIVIQYCDNDAGENVASLKFNKDEFNAQARENWIKWRDSYFTNKKKGLWFVIQDIADRVINGKIISKTDFFNKGNARKTQEEADNFSKILKKYEQTLLGKKIIVFESSGYGLNSNQFSQDLTKTLKIENPKLDITVLNTNDYVGRDGYYMLDDHLNKKGHNDVAKMLVQYIQ